MIDDIKGLRYRKLHELLFRKVLSELESCLTTSVMMDYSFKADVSGAKKVRLSSKLSDDR